MLTERELFRSKLKLFLDKGNIDEAMALVQVSTLIQIDFIIQWFFYHLERSKERKHWITFWEKLLYSDIGLDKLNLQNEWITYSIHNIVSKESRDLLLILFQHLNATSENQLVNEILKHHECVRVATGLLMLIKTTFPTVTKTLYEKLIHASCNHYNRSLLQRLKEMEQSLECQFTLSNLTPKQNAIYDKLMSIDRKKASFIYTKICPFITGFGNIEYISGLLALAERKARKHYTFNPTLIDRYFTEQTGGEFPDYLNTLKQAPKPLTELFVCTGSHWIAGTINITQDNVVRVLFLDPLGSSQLYATTIKAIFIFDTIFPNSHIFVAEEQRLHGSAGCSVFALDDVAHLATLRLEDKYKQSGLFGYLEDTPHKIRYIQDITDDSKIVEIIECKTPLSLTRTMQSTQLIQKIIPERSEDEQRQPINKKGETAAESSSKFFQPRVDNPSKIQNQRLEYKLSKMADHLFDFLFTHSQEEIEALIQEATLEKFNERMQNNLTFSPKF